MNTDEEDSTVSSDKRIDITDICPGCYAAIYDQSDFPMENLRIAARNKLFKQFKVGKTALKSNSFKPEEHMAINF